MTESLYRKYRPQTFADVVGQDAIERTLRNALAQDKVSHAYLFCGPRGTGKTTTARLMAKAILCDKGVTPDPDGTCESCRMIAEGSHPDVYELDAASRTGVDNVREEIIGRVNFAPTVGRAKIYIIDEVHMLSTAAFNALLKTLEEPPDHVVFILCTTDPNKVPATIHSRCQRFDFHRISVEEIVARLGAVCVAEDVTFEPEALELIAERSDGGMRNALTSLEQLMVFSEGKVTRSAAEDLLGSLDSSDMAEIVGAIGRRDAAACFVWLAKYVETGADLAQFARDLAEHMRALYVLGLVGDDAPLEISDTERTQLMRELPYFGTDRLARLLMILGDLMNELRTSTNPRLSFEIALTRMVHPSSDLTLESLAERIETLEKGMAARPAIPVAASSQPSADEATFAAMQSEPVASRPSAAVPASSVAPRLATAVPAPGAAPADAIAAARNAAKAAAERAKARMQAGNAAAHNAALRSEMPAPAQTRSVSPAHPQAIASQSMPDDPYEDYSPVPDDYLPAEAYDGNGFESAQTGPETRWDPEPRPTRPAAARPIPNGNSPAAPAVSSEPVPATPAAPISSEAETPRSVPVSADVAEVLANPAALQRSWHATMAALKKEKNAYGVLLLSTKVSAKPDEGVVVVSFPAKSKFAYLSVRKPEVYDALERAAVQGFGATVGIQFVQEGENAPAAPIPTPAPSASTKPQPFVAPRPASVPQPVSNHAPAPQPAPAPRPAPASRPAPAPQPAPAPRPVHQAAPSSGDGLSDGDDFASMLAAGFGSGVTFEELDGSNDPTGDR